MSDLDLRLHVLGVLVEELSVVTPAMLEAGSRALSGLPETGEDQRLAAVWLAMLHAKLCE